MILSYQTSLLISSLYGYQGNFEGREYNIMIGGLDIWYLQHDGTMLGMQSALKDARANSPQKFTADETFRAYGLPVDLGRWYNFSVIDKTDFRI